VYFKPRQVPRTNLKSWFVEALELSKRNAVAFVMLGLLAMGLGAIDKSRITLICLFPLFLSLGCVVAKSADNSESLLKAIVEVAPRAWARVVIIGSTPLIVVLLFILLIEIIIPGNIEALTYRMEQTQALSATRTSIDFGLVVLIGAVAIGMMLWITSYLWFFWTLIVIGQLTVVGALNQSFEGFFINKFVVWPYAVSVLTLLLVFHLPMIFIPWLAITTSMMYVSYRDVWLGRKDNKPITSDAIERVLS